MSDLDGLRVNHAELDNAAEQMKSTARQIDTTLNTLEQQVSGIVQAWGGEQKVAYESAKRTWDDAMKQMMALLDDNSRTVYDANSAYREADRRGANRFGG